MYKIYCDGNLIYSPQNDEFIVFNPKLKLEVNKVGELEFSIFPSHLYYGNLLKLKSIITVYDDDYLVFRGRILNDEQGFYNEKQVTCEGELAFLNDSIQRPFQFTGTPAQLFTQFINAHNAQCEVNQRFTIGNITVTDPNNYIARSESGYLNTWEAINEKLIETHKGYLHVRHENGLNYIDYLADFSTLNAQTIEFGKNLMDFKRTTKGEDIATAIIPLGAKNEETGERVTITSVNGGLDYIVHNDAVTTFGKIFKVVTWDDVTDPSNLLTKANAYLATTINLSVSIEIDAVDLPAEASYRLGSYVKVKDTQHSIPDQNFLIKKLDIDLQNPANNKLSLGTTYTSFTDESLSAKRYQGELLEIIEVTSRDVKDYALQQAQTAESASKAYADQKASEAQVASEAYALAQAQLAQAEAEAHADGIVSAEEQARIAEATAKLSEAKSYADTKKAEAISASQQYADGVLSNYATTVNGTLDSLQDQIDGSITTWFYGVAPTTSNAPASSWTTTDMKNNHLGDLYYNTVTGYSYRWQVVNNVHSWQRITDTDVTKALADASKAQDTADSKRRVFSAQPAPPYDVNDLWVQGTSGDIMRCTVARATGNYIAGDWTKASKYTDDTVATANLATAKSYADTKALEAQNASNAYALAQAQLAQTNAEAYADGVVTAEEQARIDADTAKLAEAKTYADTKKTEAISASQAYADIVQTNAQNYALGLANNLQTQVDGKIETFAQTADPSTAWTTTELKNAHNGDLWYHTTSKITKIWTGTAWTTMEDSVANSAQALAQTKNKIFTAQPTTPYILGDLWVQGTSGDIMRCSTARASGAYVAGDWVKASKYTDDTVANANLVTAKAYAETKATEARTASEAYALAQANLAQTNAEAYADGIVTAEEQARINDATAKLAEAKTYAETKATEAETASKAYADIVQTNAQNYALGLANNLQTQVDGKIETFAQTADPSTAWTTTELKNAHNGDLWYHTTSKITKIWTGTAWTTMEDSVANSAQALAQTKNKIFTAQPTTPYILGDLWVQGTSGDIMRCSTARASGAYVAGDWVKASKYTDDTVANANLVTAKAYADTKKTEAENASKAYADAQILAEQVRADAYADGVLTDAEAYAIAQAEAKRDEAKTYADTKKTEAISASQAYTDALKIGDRNILIGTGTVVTNALYAMKDYTLSEPIVAGEKYTVAIKGTLGADRTSFSLYNSGGSFNECTILPAQKGTDGVFYRTFTAIAGARTNEYIRVYQMASTGTSSSTIEWIKLVKGEKTSRTWNPAPEDVEAYTNDSISALSTELISAINEKADSVMITVGQKHYLKGETDTLISDLNTKLTQTKTGWEFAFNTLTKNVTDNKTGADASFNEIKDYIKFVDGNILLGKSGNKITLKIENNRIAFWDTTKNSEVAYFADQKLYITDGHFLSQMRVGNFAFVPRDNGNLSFRKVT